MSIWAIIPARGGSKGFPGKNLAPLAGRPLICHSIDAALAVAAIDRVLVSSDDEGILACAAAAGAETLRRPPVLAMDDTPTTLVVAHLLEQLAEPDRLAELTLVLLQATSPLRTSTDLEAALAEYSRPNTGSVISVYEPQHSPLKSFVADEDGYIRGIAGDRMPFMPRQRLPKAYYPNGALYIFNAASFLHIEDIPVDRCRPFVMTRERSIDIDSPADLRAAEVWLRTHHD